MERKIWYSVTVIWALIFAGFMLYTVPEPTWSQTEVVEDIDQRFMDLKLADSKLNLVYRNSIDRGVMLKTLNAESGIFDSLRNYVKTETWSTQEVIDRSMGSGSYLSAAEVGGELMVAYQDASIGDERVILASKEVSNWSKQVVDDVNNGGVNVGMYTSLTSYRDNPLVLYHSPTQGLKSANREDGQWDTEVITEDMGWFTDSTSCDQEAFAAYRGRDSNQLKISSFDGSWSTESTNSSVKSALSIGEVGCGSHLIYLSEGEQIVYRNPSGQEKIINDSDYSDVSIDTSQGIRASYYNYGEGIVYLEKNEDGWDRTRLTNSSNTGKYNELAVDDEGNIHLIFTQDSDLIHAEKNLGQVQNLIEIKNYVEVILGFILIIFLAISFRET